MLLNRLRRELDVLNSKNLPLKVSVSPSSNRLMIWSASLVRSTAFAKRNIETLEFLDLVADPNPKLEARLPEIASTTAISSASRTGLWNGISSTPSGILMRFVRAAIAAAAGSIEGR